MPEVGWAANAADEDESVQLGPFIVFRREEEYYDAGVCVTERRKYVRQLS
jgi:hypothetical protein